ncbi:hypothetical protein ACS0TY_002942 [Phlomoides rotata]
MAVASSAMKNQEESNSSSSKQEQEDDQHDCDMVMPGFRFHPTEEELVEFYLRRKVEGKRFNVELITFLDLYRYDPWELPALAAIGEKEWYFYVPRDKKYRNGDRPNRVTTSGYWKATGADRMIRSENFRSIGLKKTLVFYSGKAPKGIRTSWIMNEYRLPLHETERLQKAEISLCRVYKRAGVEDHPSLPRSLPTTRASSSRNSQPTGRRFQGNIAGSSDAKIISDVASTSSCSTDHISTTTTTLTPIPLSNHMIDSYPIPAAPTSLLVHNYDHHSNKMGFVQSKQLAADCNTSLPPNCTTIFAATSSTTSHANIDDLHSLVMNFNYPQQQYPSSLPNIAINHDDINIDPNMNAPNLASHFPTLQPQPAAAALNVLPASFPAAYSDRLWEWNAISEASKDFTNTFK